MPRHPDTTLTAIKDAVDIVSLAGDYLTLRRAGRRYKALCPFHDDHNPSLELNPERQSFKCWSCGAGGDIFDFVKGIERVDFPEALRVLAERAGVPLENRSKSAAVSGSSKSDLLGVNDWARGFFATALDQSRESRDYLESRGITTESARKFHLGYAPMERGRLLSAARVKGLSIELLEQAGLVVRSEEPGGPTRERFRGRVVFPIHDDRGRVVGFGGRILPGVERALAAQGKSVAKYVNSPETAVFHKRSVLYGADLARTACREAGFVAVVEGYTDVIAAHQVGLGHVVGTLGTAFGDDHLRLLRRLADRVVLIFDGDQAGLTAADRALELFLGSDLELLVLPLPANLDPCDFLMKEGAERFRALIQTAVDPVHYVLERATDRFDVDSAEGARRAAEWVLGLLSRAPRAHQFGLEIKEAKVLDALAQRLRVPLETLNRLRRELERRGGIAAKPKLARETATTPQTPAIREEDLDTTDLELVRILINEPTAAPWLLTNVAPSSLCDPALRDIFQVCLDLHSEGHPPSYENLMLRLEAPAVRALAAGLIASTALSTPSNSPLPDGVQPAPWPERLEKMLDVLARRDRRNRLAVLKKAREETDQHADPDAYRAIELEYLRLLTSGRTRKA